MSVSKESGYRFRFKLQGIWGNFHLQSLQFHLVLILSFIISFSPFLFLSLFLCFLLIDVSSWHYSVLPRQYTLMTAHILIFLLELLVDKQNKTSHNVYV
jgi:hypothetical protein